MIDWQELINGIRTFIEDRIRLESELQHLEQIASEGDAFPVECQFCDTVYEFTPDDIKKLLKNA